MSCDDYSTLVITGIDVPQEVRQIMNEHRRTCIYHQSTTFAESALGTPVTPDMEKGAERIVAKYA